MKKLNSIRFRTLLCLCLMLIIVGATVWAGGPLQIIRQGVALRWNPAQAVPVVFDNGPLSAVLTRDQGAAALREILQIWEDVPTASITFSDEGFLAVDVDATNVMPFLNNVTAEGSPIIFDVDGSIIDLVIGNNSSNLVLGFANSFITDFQDDFFDGGFAVLNGVQANLSPSSSFRKTVLHEIGHLIGLDHTQAGQQFFFNSGQFGFVPMMFPFIARGPTILRLDDRAWVSWLYPEPGFAAGSGTISGSIRRRPGGPFAGSNVVAVPVSQQTPAGGLTEGVDHVSAVSDFLLVGDGGFELPGLPGGDYVLFIEPLNSAFTDGSGVGPFDTRFTGFPKDYYNGADESGDPAADDPTQRTVLTVAAGQILPDIVLVSNETVGQLDSLGDDDEEQFPFPSGFMFPFYGTTYETVVVNSDGNLTFVSGDGGLGEARDEARFLGRSPRIAPRLDPTAGGDVTSTFENNSLTFAWTDVPEFAQFGTRPGNTFSVTLFPTGDILFRYGETSILRDSGLQAIVGLSPGGLTSGTPTDLSELSNPIGTPAGPIYQVFAGASFDLNNQTLFFDASRGQFFYLYPFLDGDFSSFTGFAITNDSDETAILDVEGLNADGVFQDYPKNPGLELLESKKQLAQLGAEFFDLPINSERDGWVRIGANTDQLASFFLFGDGLADPQSKLDGSVAFTEQGNPLYFTRIFDGAETFPRVGGAEDAVTTLYLANPNSDPITLTLTLFDGMGNAVGDPVERELPGKGCLKERVIEVFGVAQVVGGFIRVDVNGPGAVGFELVELEDTLLGFNASFGNDGTTSYSGQLASGNLAPGVSIFTSVKISNVSGMTRVVTLTATDEEGSEIGTTMVTLEPNQSLESSVADLFGLGDVATAPSVVGSLTVTADGDGVIGDVVFGEAFGLRYGAALPLQTQLLRRAIFSQVANAEDAEDPSRQTFTGLAFANPNGETVDITIRVFTLDCQLVGETTIQLVPGGRIATLLAALVAESIGQTRGYIEVLASLPVVAQLLLGNQILDYLSAVPPTVYQ